MCYGRKELTVHEYRFTAESAVTTSPNPSLARLRNAYHTLAEALSSDSSLLSLILPIFEASDTQTDGPASRSVTALFLPATLYRDICISCYRLVKHEQRF